MICILVASTSPEVESRVAAATTATLLRSRFDRLPEDPEDLLRLPAGVPLPQVVVLDGTADADRAIALAARTTERHPNICLVLAAPQDPALALPALRAGIRDVIDPRSADLRAALQLATDVARRQQDAAQAPVAAAAQPAAGRLISVVSPKGGVGKTTVATNVAVGLATVAPEATVLVDLDIQFGDVASALDLEPEYFLADTLSAPARRDSMVLKTYLTRHPTGLHVICAPDAPGDADAITGEDVGRLLDQLTAEFRFVVVDTAPGLGDHTLAALDRTTDLVLLTNMEVPGVRGLRKELDALAELRLLPAARQVVLNFADSRGLLSVADVEAVLGTRVDLRLPRSKSATAAVNEGVPLLQGRGRDGLTKGLRTLVQRLSGVEPARPAKDSSSRRGQPDDANTIKPRHAASRWRRARLVA